MEYGNKDVSNSVDKKKPEPTEIELLPISTKKKAKLSDTQSDDTEDAGIRTIYNKYSEEKEEMFSEVEIK